MQGHFLGQIKKAVIPEEKSWAHLDAIRAATNQDSCGSCWAVATTTVLRANAEIKGINRTFSPQELVSCAPNPHHCGGDGGCSGSTIELAMNWVMEEGLDTNEGTPYKAQDTQCKKTASSLLWLGKNNGDSDLQDMLSIGFHEPKSSSSAGVDLGLRGWERLPENEYQPLLNAVATVGPVGISVAAGEWSLFDSGIFDGCGKDAVIDHAVTLIGYGKDHSSGDKYWLIKNSWGNSWGEHGNIRLLRNEGNVHCGVDRQPEVGTGCDGGPKSVPVCGMCGILYDTVAVHFNQRL
jgi:cathepsin L